MSAVLEALIQAGDKQTADMLMYFFSPGLMGLAVHFLRAAEEETYLLSFFQGMQSTSLESSRQGREKPAEQSRREDMMRAHLLWTLTVRISPSLPAASYVSCNTHYPYQ